jgi:hypothetical protein
MLESWLLVGMLAVRMETCRRIGGSEAAGELAASCWLLESWLLAVGCWRAGCWLVDAGRMVGCWRAGCWLVMLGLAAGRMLAVRMETCRRKGGSEAAGELAASCWLLESWLLAGGCWRGSVAAGELAAGWWMLVGCWLCGWKRAGGKADRRLLESWLLWLLESWLLAGGCWSDAGRADGNVPGGRRIGGCWRAGWWLRGELAAGWWMLESWLLVGCWLCGWKRAGG